jgi:hypothetical protein
MNKTLKQQWTELAKIRRWVTDKLPAATDGEIQKSLFEARQAIAFAMLHLERVEYRTGGDYSDSENQVE